MLRSTREFLRQSGFNLRTLHGYIYARWTRQYIRFLFRLPAPESGLPAKVARWLSDHYHGKVLTHEHACAIVDLDRDIPLQDLDQIVPYPVARDIVLTGPPDIVAYECVCRHERAAHCTPTQVCMVVGKPGTDMILEHHPNESRRLTREEALVLLNEEHERGHVHSAWFKDALMNRFYAICNCCKCCCGGISMMRKGVPMLASSGFVAEVNPELCAACRNCVVACPFEALAAAEEPTGVLWERCMGCGVCETVCGTGAIALVRDERKGIPLDVRALA